MKEFRLTGQPVELQAAKGKGPKRFSMLAYTGQAIDLGWGTPVVVDLSGMKGADRKLPIFMDHNPALRVGHSERATIDAAGLHVEGVVSGGSASAEEVLASGALGFPWQASIGATAEETIDVRPGATHEVNGRTIEGPATIVVASTLKEVSFVSLGADDATHASISAKAKAAAQTPRKVSAMTFEEYVASLGLDPAALSEEAKAALMTAYEASSSDADTAADVGAMDDNKDEDEEDKKAMAKAAKSPALDIRAEAAKETKRVNAIRKICAAHPGLETEVDGKEVDIEAHAIEAGWDRNETELAVIRASRGTGPAIHAPAAGDNRPGVLACALAINAGLPRVEKHYDVKTLEAANKHHRHLGLHQLMLICASAAGYVCRMGEGITRGNLREVLAHAYQPNIRAASSSLSLPGILGAVANKELLDGYMEEDTTWKEIAAVKSVQNFQTVTSYRMLDNMQYEELGPNGEIKHGSAEQESYTRKAKTYAKMFALTREAIINDDLGAFDDIRTRLGAGAARKFNDVFWAAFIDNSSLFPTDNSLTNYISGATTNLGADGVGLGLGVKAFRQMTSPTADGAKRVGGTPSILLVPPEVETYAEQLYQNTNMAYVENASANIHAKKYRPIVQVRLSDSTFTGYSTTAWYLLQDPKVRAAIVVSFLNGQQTPIVESADADFDTLGIQFRGYHDFGVDQFDPLAGIKSKGAA